MKTQAPLFPFQHKKILQTAMPLGGIGAGCLCLNGYGGLQDFSIRNRPHITALPDGHSPRDAAFALLFVKGESIVPRLVEGPLPPGKIYDQGLQTQGYRHGGHEGLPRFRRCRFSSGYPFGRVELSDPKMPLEVEITGWSPFIPLDDLNSGIPCAVLEYTLRNSSLEPVEFGFSYHLSHPAVGAATGYGGTRNSVIPGKGIHFTNTEAAGAESYGSASLSFIGRRPRIKGMWLRGRWFDAISSLWREAETGTFTANDGRQGAGLPARNGGSLFYGGALKPGEEITIPVLLTWHFPNCSLTCGPKMQCCDGEEDCCAPKWRPFYVSRWSDARQVAEYVHRQYRQLRARTVAFQNALLESSYPAEVLDAISANLAILKSPTVLRQENGNLWGWEGCFTEAGCCSGSCTHVWNYAQTLSHLFPQLERTLREQELERSMDEAGHINFRAALPDRPTDHNFHAAADGQLGGMMKLYRDWQISGDTEWLRHLYPLAKRSLEYCIAKWDPEHRGALFEPHHNTYDIEFWGPDGMCTSVYLGALSAMQAMAAALGENADASIYGKLAERCAKFMEEELFNGEYFEQRVQYRGLKDSSFVDLIEGRSSHQESEAMVRLLKKEGPKYQYGQGCLSDGIIGAWMAKIYGIEIPLDQNKVRKNLRAIFRHNFRPSLLEHANCQRPGYAIGDESGLLLCSWPRGGKPTLPFVYSDEVWTGIEYQVASHLIAEGLVKEGLRIVKSVRARHDGEVRNPWNEYECGNYYARAMASFALLGAFSGFRYSAVEAILWIEPKIGPKTFKTFYSTATGFGVLALAGGKLTVTALEGFLKLRKIVLTLDKKKVELQVNATVRPKSPASFPMKAK